MKVAAPGPLLRAAERDARALERERLPWADALARLVRAGVARQRGGKDAAALLRDGAQRCEATAMRLYAAAARRYLGHELGGAEGQALAADAEAWMAGQQVRNPGRMAALLVPGFAVRASPSA
jgi:hypothetical protein